MVQAHRVHTVTTYLIMIQQIWFLLQFPKYTEHSSFTRPIYSDIDILGSTQWGLCNTIQYATSV